MRVEIQHLPASQMAGYRLEGPWEMTVPQGFSRLSEWVNRNRLKGEWLAVYHGNPQQMPADHLEVDTGISVPPEFILPLDSEGVSLRSIPAACYAVAQVQVSDGNFTRPWCEFFDEWLPGSGYQRADGPCFDRYLTDGSQTGTWDFLICIPVEKRQP
ncbi:GyrI-like domain-containing protein [Erwinia sp. SLM-02]|uniref:GyrI-like domain-containing protein n=1 Tax=Erwinia sp. SLM-02 TaxID=3020057 RepID=UPI0028D5F878|nr:GyrI-like domain-containing protein [uncultured Erwinia sp.]